MPLGSCSSSLAENFAWRSARLTVFSSAVFERSMTVRSFGVTGMPLTTTRSIVFGRWRLIRGWERFVGAETSNGRPSQFTRSWRAAAE